MGVPVSREQPGVGLIQPHMVTVSDKKFSRWSSSTRRWTAVLPDVICQDDCSGTS